jgi:hypothetical protein
MSADYEYENAIQKVYIAYYGRPADPVGQQFWAQQLQTAAGDLSQIIDAFGNSDEFQSEYGELSQNELVNTIYQQLFGRDADEEGLIFYVEVLESGTGSLASISLDILNGAQNDDLLIVENKVTFVEQFTLQITTDNKVYDSDAAIPVKAQLDSINADGASRDKAIAEMDGLVSSFETSATSYFGDSEAGFVFGGESLIEITEPGETNLLLSDAAEIVSILNPEAEVNIFDFSPNDRLVLGRHLLDDTDLATSLVGSERSFTDLLKAGGASDQAAEDIEAFLTHSKDHRIDVEIERKTDKVFSVKLTLSTAEGSVQIWDLLLDGDTLATLGFTDESADEDGFKLFVEEGSDQVALVDHEDDDDSEEDESDDDDSEEDESDDDDSEEEESDDDDSEEDESDDDDSEEDESDDDDSEEDESDDDDSEEDESDDDDSEEEESDDDDSEEEESDDDDSEEEESDDDDSEEDESDDDDSEEDESDDDNSEEDESDDDDDSEEDESDDDDDSEEEESDDDDSEEEESDDDDSEEEESDDDDSEEEESDDDDSEEDESDDDDSSDDFQDNFDPEFDQDDAAVMLIGYLSGLDVFGFE